MLNGSTHGVIKLTLHNGSYDWQFVNDGESTFTDSGTGSCHGRPDNTAPTTSIAVNGQALPRAVWEGWFTAHTGPKPKVATKVTIGTRRSWLWPRPSRTARRAAAQPAGPVIRRDP